MDSSKCQRTEPSHMAQERRVRRILGRQGLALVKARRRKQALPEYGSNWIRPSDGCIGDAACEMNLGEVEVWSKYYSMKEKVTRPY